MGHKGFLTVHKSQLPGPQDGFQTMRDHVRLQRNPSQATNAPTITISTIEHNYWVTRGSDGQQCPQDLILLGYKPPGAPNGLPQQGVRSLWPYRRHLLN